MDSQKHLVDLKAIEVLAEGLYKNLFDLNNESDFFLMQLFGNVVEHVRSYRTLFENELFISTQAIARTIMELCVDIINMDKDDKYASFLLAEFCYKKQNKTKGKVKLTFIELKKGILENEGFTEKSLKDFSIRKKFITAGKKRDYDKIYTLLCNPPCVRIVVASNF